MNTKINLVAFYTILRKEILRVLRIWVQTIVPPAITMTLYFVIFGNLIGSRIGNMEGYTYMQFIAPGIIMMSVITNSYGNVVSSFFGAKYGGYLDEMLVAPVANATIILGHIAGGIIRGLLVGSMVTIIALSFTDLKLSILERNIVVLTTFSNVNEASVKIAFKFSITCFVSSSMQLTIKSPDFGFKAICPEINK